MNIFGGKWSQKIRKTAQALGLAALGLFAHEGARADDIARSTQSAVQSTIYAPESSINQKAAQGLIIHKDGRWEHSTGVFMSADGVPREINQDSCSLELTKKNQAELQCSDITVATAVRVSEHIQDAIRKNAREEAKQMGADIDIDPAPAIATLPQEPPDHAKNPQIDEGNKSTPDSVYAHQAKSERDQMRHIPVGNQNDSKGFWSAFLGGAIGALSAMGAGALWKRKRMRKKDVKLNADAPTRSPLSEAISEQESREETINYATQAQNAFQLRKRKNTEKALLRAVIGDLKNSEIGDHNISTVEKNMNFIDTCEALQFLFFEINSTAKMSIEDRENNPSKYHTGKDESHTEEMLVKLRQASDNAGLHMNKMKADLGADNMENAIIKYAEMQQHIGHMRIHLNRCLETQRYEKMAKEFLQRMDIGIANLRALMIPQRQTPTNLTSTTRENA